MTVIVFSCVAYVVATVPSFSTKPDSCDKPICNPADTGAECTELVCTPEVDTTFETIETYCIAIFTIDYFLRLFSVNTIPIS